ncbi:PadR family transcriptional regulator [Candidatus Bathyarchaeota archaeon]|nr:PadR family transcriptional regulator [Candidatus Bathyarchaeota archaeon]
MFERGDLKTLLLLSLRQSPMHGYGLMKSISEDFLYQPSPGVVYPTLQMLQDMGYIKSSEENGKKVYSITEEGLKYLEDNRASVMRIEANRSQLASLLLRKDIFETNRLLFLNYPYLNQRKIEKIHEAIREMNRKIREAIFEESS